MLASERGKTEHWQNRSIYTNIFVVGFLEGELRGNMRGKKSLNYGRKFPGFEKRPVP